MYKIYCLTTYENCSSVAITSQVLEFSTRGAADFAFGALKQELPRSIIIRLYE